MNKMVDNNIAVMVYPTTTENVRPCKLIRKYTVVTAPMGIVMSNEHAVAIEVAKRYLPCAPIRAQHTIPTFIVMLPSATKGNNSDSMAWIVGSLVSHDGSTLLMLMKQVVTMIAKIVARSIL